ncbi:MAG: hypothetical protein EBZ49_16130, partial [Proteobacteria bacterium]|nr:hypothetical protein [Pseudomonadota bacterium]
MILATHRLVGLQTKSSTFFVLVVFWGLVISSLVKAENKGSPLKSSNQVFQGGSKETQPIIWSPKSGETIQFLENDRSQIRLLGELRYPGELFINGDKISLKNKKFDYALKLNSTEQNHTIVIKQSQNPERVFELKTRFLKVPSGSVQAKIRTDDGKVVTKTSWFTGSFPSSDWIEIALAAKPLPSENLAKETPKEGVTELVKNWLGGFFKEEKKPEPQVEPEPQKVPPVTVATPEPKPEPEPVQELPITPEPKAPVEEAKEEVAQPEEREVASVENELEEKLPPRNPLGFKIIQGIGSFNLEQSEFGTFSSL